MTELELIQSDDKSKKAFHLWIFGMIFSLVFTLIIWLLGPYLDRFVLGPDQGPNWYYWKLPLEQVTLLSRISYWALYLSHQILLWIGIYWVQKNYVELKTNPSKNLTRYNYYSFSINIIFIILHLIQTHLFYDGLAQDVPILTSQGSVIIMLAVLLVMDNPRRGLAFGKEAGKPFSRRVSEVYRHNHVYIFTWALVYTFWFHPMDSDPQLLSGFFYMFLLLTQVSLAYTNVHLNRKWVTILEAYVAIHGTIVAIFNTNNLWPMFLTGFLALIVYTYIYGLGLPRWSRIAFLLAYIGLIVWIYVPSPFGYGRDPMRLAMLEIFWIPIVLYGLAFLFASIGWLYLKYVKPKLKKEN
jgi:hypothetical protein